MGEIIDKVKGKIKEAAGEDVKHAVKNAVK